MNDDSATKKRKIIQICSAGVKQTNWTQCDYILTALCNDGTIWVWDFKHPWNQIDPIPQDETP